MTKKGGKCISVFHWKIINLIGKKKQKSKAKQTKKQNNNIKTTGNNKHKLCTKTSCTEF